MRYKCQDVQAMYDLSPSTFRYWRQRLFGLGRHRQEGLFYPEVVALGFLHHLVRYQRYRIRELAHLYPRLLFWALDENLPHLAASRLMVSAAGDRLMLLPRTENIDSYAREGWQNVDAAELLAQIDSELKSGVGLLEEFQLDACRLEDPNLLSEDGYVNGN